MHHRVTLDDDHDQRSVVSEVPVAKARDFFQDAAAHRVRALHPHSLRGLHHAGLAELVVEPVRVCGFGDAIGREQEAVARQQMERAPRVLRFRKEA